MAPIGTTSLHKWAALAEGLKNGGWGAQTVMEWLNQPPTRLGSSK